MNNIIIKFLSTLGYNISSDYYGYIESWKHWWENDVAKFHRYHDQNGELRYIYRLGMAKRGVEDWSSILYTERDELICNDTNNQNYLNQQLKELKFNEIIANNIETAFWSGTAVTVLRIKNAKLLGKQIVADDNTKTELITVGANQIVPLRIENGEIIDIALISEMQVENRKVYYIEIHKLEDKGYKINNYYIDEQGNPIENTGVVEEYYTGSKTPLFSVLKPRILNNIENNNGLGLSIYANGIDQLKACDIAYNNFVKDFELGGKKVFYNKTLVKYNVKEYTDENGKKVRQEIPVYPDDITKQQFQVLSDEMSSVNDETLIHEYNPDLRVEENEGGINFALNMYAFKLGMGKYYRFENGTVVTATQYIGENRDLVANAKKHRSAVNEYTRGIARAILLVGRTLFGQNVNENDEITLTDKDGFLIGDEELKEQYRQDFQAGLMSKKTFLMKARGLSEEQALAELQEINNDNPDITALANEEDNGGNE